jgi:hypothetical protein|tara:strand:- start:305 stop:526 length:222 start_codon:yes stop_codon:yes gene_type:complete
MRNTSKWLKKTMHRERTKTDILFSKLEAFNKNKNVMVTIPNPAGKSEKNKPFIRVPAKEVWKEIEPYRMKESS